MSCMDGCGATRLSVQPRFVNDSSTNFRLCPKGKQLLLRPSRRHAHQKWLSNKPCCGFACCPDGGAPDLLRVHRMPQRAVCLVWVLSCPLSAVLREVKGSGGTDEGLRVCLREGWVSLWRQEWSSASSTEETQSWPQSTRCPQQTAPICAAMQQNPGAKGKS